VLITFVVYKDEEIIAEVKKWKPRLVSIDAPLGNPVRDGIRECERALMKRGVKVFPCTFGGMKKLTSRGIFLAKKLRSMNFEVIETYPGSAQDLLNIPRKGVSITALREGLISYGITGVPSGDITDHELDAITSALVGKLYLEGKTTSLGKKEESQIVIPLPKGQRELF
jgi:predicted nuclease with RNAse H fold